MKSARQMIHLLTSEKEQILNITRQVSDVVLKSGIREGLALVYPMHTSSAVYVSDSDTGLTQDLRDILATLVPEGRAFRHDLTDPKKNAAAHLKSCLTGHHVVLPVTTGRLDLGMYHTIYYADFDGKREKEVLVKIIGD